VPEVVSTITVVLPLDNMEVDDVVKTPALVKVVVISVEVNTCPAARALDSGLSEL
jgi:hypothetical protein